MSEVFRLGGHTGQLADGPFVGCMCFGDVDHEEANISLPLGSLLDNPWASCLKGRSCDRAGNDGDRQLLLAGRRRTAAALACGQQFSHGCDVAIQRREGDIIHRHGVADPETSLHRAVELEVCDKSSAVSESYLRSVSTSPAQCKSRD
jgi:hypothetical protein